jgi:3-methylcrotonyl-CoA carboxylase alpha subunit
MLDKVINKRFNTMFDKILIANRGEIACRVIKTAQKLGISTVAVYSDADHDALHVHMADEAIHIGAPPSQESYLVADRIVQAALSTGAQAIHPGYGFLSENAEFAETCANNGLVFIGPPSAAIIAMGSKSAAKTIMADAGVPLVPGYHGADQNPALLKQSADAMGYPVLLKAVAGGGGKGMRQVWSADQFEQALGDAKRESKASFNNDDMLVEKYLTQPRHVEVQVFCDQHGNGVYLFERDCSVQRRHQKIIEEAPAPNLPKGLREQMGEAAVKAAQAIDYQGAGTVEFLLDEDGSFYFMEMNTRLQVEHPVTEFITGQDLVAWQLKVALGEPLPLSQAQLQIKGHSFEARIYAEDPENDFMPATGHLTHLVTPSQSAHVRVDTGVVQGDQVSPFYDPMIAKLIVWDEDRARALARLIRALGQYQISGVTTNIEFLKNLASSSAFVEADLDTGFIDKHTQEIFRKVDVDIELIIPLASLYLTLQAKQLQAESAPEYGSVWGEASVWDEVSGWRLNQANTQILSIIVNQQQHIVSIEQLRSISSQQYRIKFADKEVIARGHLEAKVLLAEINGHQQKHTIVAKGSAKEGHYTVFTNTGAIDFSVVKPDLGEDNEVSSVGDFRAPMNGTIVDILINSGDKVSLGDPLLIMEAMKMQHTISAPSDGVVSELFCSKGDLVDGGSELLTFTPS